MFRVKQAARSHTQNDRMPFAPPRLFRACRAGVVAASLLSSCTPADGERLDAGRGATDAGPVDAAGLDAGGGGTDAGDGSPATDAARAHASDAAPLADALAGRDGGGGHDAGPAALHGCLAFEDRRAADADRTVRFDSSPSLAYTPSCILVAVGQVVVFDGPLARHPLAPGRSPVRVGEPDGSPGSPIPAMDTGERVEVTFEAAGSFPFYCPIHDLGGMVGVVRAE